MRATLKQQVRIVVPVVTATVADVVFSNWADEFDVWAGWDWHSKWRRPASMKFCCDALPAPSFIYMAVAPTGPIKVGLSEKPIQRVSSMRGYEAVVAVAGQDRGAERRLHDELKSFQVMGGRNWAGHLGVKYEWYVRKSPVLSLAYRLANAAGAHIEESFMRRRGSAA